MNLDFSSTSQKGIYFVSACNRLKAVSMLRSKINAIGVGLAIAKLLPVAAASTAADVTELYRGHEATVWEAVAAVNELLPVDTGAIRQYTFKFFCTIHSVAFQPFNAVQIVMNGSSVAGALLGMHVQFSKEDIEFMEQNNANILSVAEAASVLLNKE